MKQHNYKIIGLMSGTSLDGLDISYVNYFKIEDEWNFELIHSATYEYSSELVANLQNSSSLNAFQMVQLDQELGRFFAEKVNDFRAKHSLSLGDIDYISSHGHTIFHQPDKGITLQIGCGTTIAFMTQLKVINDFRKKDVIAGGQGAPLVPIGDFLLFRQHANSFLNIGGFANLSFKKSNTIKAFDVCPANILINWYMRKLGHPFDKNGNIARSYPIDDQLLIELNSNPIYSDEDPQSLALEWLEENIIPVIEAYECSLESKIATITEYVAIQISKRLNKHDLKSVYITGGGAKNSHLISRIQTFYEGEIHIPKTEIIDFKEAIIFGFLGVLYLENVPNCLSSVTSAQKDVIGGTLHLP